MGEIEGLLKILKDHEMRLAKLESSYAISKPSKKQQTTGRKSVRDLLIVLKREGFFKEPKNLAEIIARLSEKNYTVSHGDLTQPLARLVKSDDLERKRIDKKWAYVAR